MDYQTYDPREDLSAFVKCYWTLDGPKEEMPKRQKIVPDGCMEMIFHFGDLYKQYIDKENSIIQPRCFVIGQLTTPLEIEPTGEIGIFSVRFHPGGFIPFSTIPIKKFENTAVALDQVYGIKGKEIADQILTTQTSSERIKFIEAFLLDRLRDKTTINNVVKSTVDTILAVEGSLKIDQLAKDTRITRRQLERKFSSTVGISPKQLSKTIRLQATLKKLLSEEFENLTAIAHEGDYYDQAHFIKDFKEFTGLTPKEFYGEHLKMSSMFINAD